MSHMYAGVRKRAVEIGLAEVAKDVREDFGPNSGTHIDKYYRWTYAPVGSGMECCGMFGNYCFRRAAEEYGMKLPWGNTTFWKVPPLASQVGRRPGPDHCWVRIRSSDDRVPVLLDSTIPGTCNSPAQLCYCQTDGTIADNRRIDLDYQSIRVRLSAGKLKRRLYFCG